MFVTFQFLLYSPSVLDVPGFIKLFVCQREGMLFIKIKRLKNTGEKNVKNPSLGMLGWPLTLKIEHQGPKVCEGPMRAGYYGSFATILVRVPCLGLYQNTKAALDTKDSLGRNTERVRVWLFLIKSSIFSDCFCAFRACPSSEGWQRIFYHNLTWFKISSNALRAWN